METGKEPLNVFAAFAAPIFLNAATAFGSTAKAATMAIGMMPMAARALAKLNTVGTVPMAVIASPLVAMGWWQEKKHVMMAMVTIQMPG